MKSLVPLFLIIILPKFGISQERIVTGTVTNIDEATLPEVKVFCSDKTIFTYTDENGHYKITLPDDIDTLFFSKPGYVQKQVAVRQNSRLDVQLEIESLFNIPFEDLLKIKVSTVSLQDQFIDNAPGVITVITKQELRQYGIRTVKEALTMIAGFSLMQNDDEQILSVRGIFATTNQKILVMRDGHALNEANLDIPQTEYSISIENIKKIEIVRGSGASIYGNSALAAVINIITDDAENTSIRFDIGNYGQLNVEAYSCSKLKNDGSIMIYGRYASINGEKIPVSFQPAGVALPGLYRTGNNPDNYDVGFKYTIKDFLISYASQKHRYKTYWTTQGGYTNVDSLVAEPGLQTNTEYVEVRYRPQIGRKVKLNFIHYIDFSRLYNTRLVSPIDSITYLKGRFQVNEWNTRKLGANYFGTIDYSEKGQMVLGISFEQRNYLDSWVASNTIDSSLLTYSPEPFFPVDNEIRGATYIQAQHALFNWLLVDIGARLDLAQQYSYSFNPRAALIIKPIEKINLKLIYTEAFQAPGYSYRNSNAEFSGSISQLEPEKLNTFQAAVRYNYGFSSYVEVTAYYNRLHNLITRTGDNYYTNFGKVGSYGLELDLRHSIEPLSLFANYSLLLPDTNYTDLRFKQNNVYNNEFKHFPKHSINFGANYRIFEFVGISITAQYFSAFKAVQNHSVEERFLLNSSVELNLVKNASFFIRAYNLFDKKYKLGDPSVIPIEQPGRWLLFSFNYTINHKK